MNKQKIKEFLREHWRLSTLCFKWSNSGVCRIYDRRGDKTKFYAGGYGYDKKGTCLSQLMNKYFRNELEKLNSSKFYGLTHYNSKAHKYQKRSSKHTKSYVDGACGFECMITILNKIGFTMQYVYENNNSIIYILKSKGVK